MIECMAFAFSAGGDTVPGLFGIPPATFLDGCVARGGAYGGVIRTTFATESHVEPIKVAWVVEAVERMFKDVVVKRVASLFREKRGYVSTVGPSELRAFLDGLPYADMAYHVLLYVLPVLERGAPSEGDWRNMHMPLAVRRLAQMIQYYLAVPQPGRPIDHLLKPRDPSLPLAGGNVVIVIDRGPRADASRLANIGSVSARLGQPALAAASSATQCGRCRHESHRRKPCEPCGTGAGEPCLQNCPRCQHSEHTRQLCSLCDTIDSITGRAHCHRHCWRCGHLGDHLVHTSSGCSGCAPGAVCHAVGTAGAPVASGSTAMRAAAPPLLDGLQYCEPCESTDAEPMQVDGMDGAGGNRGPVAVPAHVPTDKEYSETSSSESETDSDVEADES